MYRVSSKPNVKKKNYHQNYGLDTYDNAEFKVITPKNCLDFVMIQLYAKFK